MLMLEGRAQNIRCSLLVVFGAGERLIAPSRASVWRVRAKRARDLSAGQPRLFQHQLHSGS
jgi:hypothetical protein